jgi:hypothetical protein
MCRAREPNGISMALQAHLIGQGIKIAAMIAKNQVGEQHTKKAAGYLEPDTFSGNQPWRPPPGTILPDGAEEILAWPSAERMRITTPQTKYAAFCGWSGPRWQRSGCGG